MYCGSQTLVKHVIGGRTATALRCRSWLCKDCQPQRARQLVKEVLTGAPDTFVTLTIKRSETETPDQACVRLIDAWRRARRSYMQLHKVKRLPFFAVVEATKLGWPHLHVMLRSKWIDQKWLSDTMANLIGSPIVHVRRIDSSGRAAVYVSKYAGKASHKFGTCKRYWRSKDYLLKRDDDPVFEKSPSIAFERDTRSIQHIVSQWSTFGWRIEWLTRWRARAVFDPS